MSEGFHLLRLHDSSLTPVYNVRCTLTIPPVASSAPWVSRRTVACGTDRPIFRLLKWMFVPTTVLLLRFCHEPHHHVNALRVLRRGLQQRVLRQCAQPLRTRATFTVHNCQNRVAQCGDIHCIT